MAKRGLGKGIDALLPQKVVINTADKTPVKNEDGNSTLEVVLGKIEPDKNQPRKNFSEDELHELAESIKKHGVIQPLLVEKNGERYTIVAGERRWRAAKIAGLKEVPCLVKEYTEQEKVEIQIIENLQRENLNPIEEAAAYKRLIEEFHLTQDELSERIGKKRTTITNKMRLLNLSDQVQEMLIEDKLSEGHARALLAIEDDKEQYDLAQRVFDEKLSVRDIEKEVKAKSKPKKKKNLPPEAIELIYRGLEDRIREKIGAKVSISPKDEQKGKIEIEYFSQNELEEIVNKITNG